MAHLRTDFPTARPVPRYFGNATTLLLGAAMVVLFVTIGTLTSMDSTDSAAERSAAPFNGFTIQNMSRVTLQP